MWPRRQPPPRRSTSRAPRTADDINQPEPPKLIPRNAGEAWMVLVVIALIEALLVWLLHDTLARFPGADVQARIAYAAIGVGSVAALVVYGASVIGYVLPTALGLRRR